MSKSQFFRANVGVIVANSEGKVLAAQRAERAGSWQLPQGGLDAGEEPLAGALRELEEETGLLPAQVELVASHPDWLAYELPAPARSKKTGRGQVQKWFLFRLRDENQVIDPSVAPAREFDAFKWTTLEALAEETWPVRRHIYQELARHFAEQL